MKEKLVEQFRAAFGREPEFLARAPGRIEFIGNHTDYNGGTVLGAAIDRGVWIALARSNDGRRRFVSSDRREVAIPVGPPAVQQGDERWVNYPLGVLAALDVFKKRIPEGFVYAAVSDLPEGAGLSSSAAIELASELVFLAAAGDEAPREMLVEIGRHAENKFVGVPSGILDQGVSAFGKKGSLVFIDCAGPRFELVPLPARAHFWIFNTHTKHALVDGLYAARHDECMEAARGLGVNQLVDVTQELWAAAAPRLADIPRRRAQHIVEEIARVDATVEALRRSDLVSVGRLLTASHRSSQALFENSTPELDRLVDELIRHPHVYGARLTGGGFGGAVLALTNPDFDEHDARVIQQKYAEKFGASPDVLHAQTGDGASLVT